ncbi:MAG TPA: Crp/Fnr family transcriptional regulator [Gaiellaceae bacterium]|nr:Crp/Fnr family transcriptional regulator [Gaiellaceae bacterium]
MRWRLIDGVPEEEVRRLLAIARRRSFRRNEVVFHREDPADSLHLISKGRFAIRIMTPRGETVTIGVRGPGDSFGEMALVAEGRVRSATVEALEEAETFAVYVADFQRLRSEHLSVDQVLVGFLAEEVKRQNELLLEALYVPVERRVLRRLAELSALYAADDSVIPLTQEQLAEMAGTSRATVNRVLREEQERGTVALRRGRTVVLDAEAIARRAR